MWALQSSAEKWDVIVQSASGTCVVSLEHIHDWEHPRHRPSLRGRCRERGGWGDYTLIMRQQPAPTAVFVSPVHMQSWLSGGFIWVWLRLSDSRGEEGRTLRHANSGNGPENHFISLVVIPQSAEAEIAWIMPVSVRAEGLRLGWTSAQAPREPAAIVSNGNL